MVHAGEELDPEKFIMGLNADSQCPFPSLVAKQKSQPQRGCRASSCLEKMQEGGNWYPGAARAAGKANSANGKTRPFWASVNRPSSQEVSISPARGADPKSLFPLVSGRWRRKSPDVTSGAFLGSAKMDASRAQEQLRRRYRLLPDAETASDGEGYSGPGEALTPVAWPRGGPGFWIFGGMEAPKAPREIQPRDL